MTLPTTATQHGYLVLADISGYTGFLAGTELEHAHEILTELLEVIIANFKTLLTISKLEGDAVFANVPEANVPRGETLLELVESTYAAFRDRQVSMRRLTSCTCNACRNIPMLDLKFMAHHGDYIVQNISGIRELAGSDVNLVHRLLKNHVAEATGWKAYALFTAQSLDHMQLRLENAHAQAEAYEHLGEVQTFSLNLRERYAEMAEARRVVVAGEEADLVVTTDFAVPPPIVWDWLNDPVKRNAWGGDVHWSSGDRPHGRTGTGARNHCAHGKGSSTELVLDWRPFDYATLESYEEGKKTMTRTTKLEPLPDGQGTRVYQHIKMEMRLPRWLVRPIAKFVMLNVYKFDQSLQMAAQLAADEYARSATAAELSPVAA